MSVFMIRSGKKKLMKKNQEELMLCLKNIHNEDIFQRPDEAISGCLKVNITSKQLQTLLQKVKGKVLEPNPGLEM